ncbi:RHS repeat-associated core domain-containing protein [Desulforudis sp. 1088]|uniref:RHS repeat-associated core domain-containing protein n=1 Tax=unclassified Candidatus Desulforudis TaxID=2635950 RepID=UPI003CE8F08A
MLVKTDGQGNQTYYVYGLGLIGQEENGVYRTYHFNLRGSTVALTDNNGAVTDRYQYAPYGELVGHEGTSDTPFLYNGRDGVMTDANGLYYMRARYYDPEIRRFVNKDVLVGSIEKAQSLNRYAYVNGQPVSQVDPLGESYISIGSPYPVGVGLNLVIDLDTKELGYSVSAVSVAKYGEILWSPNEFKPGLYGYGEFLFIKGGQVNYGPIGDNPNWGGAVGIGISGGTGLSYQNTFKNTSTFCRNKLNDVRESVINRIYPKRETTTPYTNLRIVNDLHWAITQAGHTNLRIVNDPLWN